MLLAWREGRADGEEAGKTSGASKKILTKQQRQFNVAACCCYCVAATTERAFPSPGSGAVRASDLPLPTCQNECLIVRWFCLLILFLFLFPFPLLLLFVLIWFVLMSLMFSFLLLKIKFLST